MSQPDGGPAFPGMWQQEPAGNWMWETGMTLRQWFAGMALQGIIASPKNHSIEVNHKKVYVTSAEEISQAAFAYADAMLQQGKEKT